MAVALIVLLAPSGGGLCPIALWGGECLWHLGEMSTGHIMVNFMKLNGGTLWDFMGKKWGKHGDLVVVFHGGWMEINMNFAMISMGI